MVTKKKMSFIWLLWLAFLLLACRLPSSIAPVPGEDTLPPVDELPLPTQEAPELPTQTDAPTPAPVITDTETSLAQLPVMENVEIIEFRFYTPSRGWAVTRDQNQVLITTDGGQTWLNTTPADLDPLPEGLTSLAIRPFFLDQDTAWFMPYTLGQATLYHTQAGGQSWEITVPPFEQATFYFLDQESGYALVGLGAGAGSHYVAIYRTDDGGTTWTMTFTHEPGETRSLPNGGSKNGITFRDVEYGWIAGAIPMDDHFYLYYTQDGGLTWIKETDIALPSDFAGSMLDIWQPVMVAPDWVYLPVRAYPPAGDIYLLVYRSEDFGETWAYRGAVEHGGAIDFVSADEGWLVAEAGLFHSTDGGGTWSAVSTMGIAPGEFFLKVDFLDSQTGWVLTTPEDQSLESLKLYRTDDGGENWALLLP